jgi:hypothetical protein
MELFLAASDVFLEPRFSTHGEDDEDEIGI